MIFTTEEKLAEVERLIERCRIRRSCGAVDERRFLTLKAVARDLRARLDGAASAAEEELERRLAAAHASKTAVGYGNGAMLSLAEHVVAYWPAVKQGLELLRTGVERSGEGGGR